MENAIVVMLSGLQMSSLSTFSGMAAFSHCLVLCPGRRGLGQSNSLISDINPKNSYLSVCLGEQRSLTVSYSHCNTCKQLSGAPYTLNQ